MEGGIKNSKKEVKAANLFANLEELAIIAKH
jgi:hypothetical protein